MWKLCLIPTLLPDGDGCALCVLCLWCNRALSHFYRQWLLCSVEEFYGTRRIWPLCMSHYVPHHGRNAGSQHLFFFSSFFCSCINELWQIGQTKAGRGTQIINFLLLLFVCARLKKKREESHIHKREPAMYLCALLLLSQLSKQLCCIIWQVSSQSPSSG